MDVTEAMRRAIALSALGLGRTAPNPTVGAVILSAGGEPVGEGFHVYADRDHAEVVALRAAGDRARGGTAVVTLSPCATTGRTTPCADALRQAGVANVVYAVADPTQPPTLGEPGPLHDEAARVNEAWLLAVREHRPFVTWKFAASLDGRVCAADGTSQWITGPEARADVHRLRSEVDAIAVGISTVLADDPHLTVREGGALSPRQPLRVVVDSAFRVPDTARVLDGAAPTLVATTVAKDTKTDHVVLPQAPDGHTDVRALLAHLYARGVRHLLVEGGPKLAGTLVDERLVDRVVGYVAPVAIGSGKTTLANAGAPTLDAAWRLRLDDVTTFGQDVRLTWRTH